MLMFIKKTLKTTKRNDNFFNDSNKMILSVIARLTFFKNHLMKKRPSKVKWKKISVKSAWKSLTIP
jgi:hypothetical protein